MTPEERAEARRLVDAATPGPWYTGPIGVDGPNGSMVADCDTQSETRVTLAADIAFIAASRTLIPQLLDALEAAERERERERERDEARLSLAKNNAVWLGERLNYEIAKKERDTARARLAEVKRERDDAYEDANHNADQVATLAKALHDARAQVETLAGALRPFTDERFCTGFSGCPNCTARDALNAAGLTNTLEETK